jgi:hypothetical protein
MSGFEKYALPRQQRRMPNPLQELVDVLTAELRERDAMLGGVLTALADIDDAAHMRLTSDNLPLKILSDAMPVWYPSRNNGRTWDDVNSWWLDHQVRDRARQEQEAWERDRKRKEILSRLTSEEREILGIKE